MISEPPAKLAGLSTEEAVSRVRAGAGWISLERLGLIRVSGPQRVKFLHNLLSNDIAGLSTGQSRLAALMNLKGQQVSWMRVMAEADALLCELPVATRDTVIETFLHYKVGAPVRFEAMDTSIIGLFGPEAPRIVEALGLQPSPEMMETFGTVPAFEGGLRVSRGRDLPAAGFTLHVATAGRAALLERLRALLGEPISSETLDTLRVEEGLPWHGIDVTLENLLHETGQLGLYHSASKGCYLGQEVVARLEGRGGNVNKHFRGLKCEAAVTADEDILADGKVVGRVTSVGRSPEFGHIAMGYVHRSHAEPGTPVAVTSAKAIVAALPFRH